MQLYGGEFADLMMRAWSYDRIPVSVNVKNQTTP